MRCVIIGGADIGNYEEIKKSLKNDDYFVFCDCGLKHKDKLNIEASLIVGDFDSHNRPETDIETIILPKEKDDTDTFFATKEAIRRGYDDFLLIGVVGNRLDHTLVNVSILNYLYENDKKGKIIDDYSEMEMVADDKVFVTDNYSYFSLLNLFGISEGVTIKNAKFPLENGVITPEYQYATSNEVLKGHIAEISVKKGKLLLIKVK